MAYCVASDLPLGQLAGRLPIEISINTYMNAAADHIDARLGHMYLTPFDVEGVDSLPSHQVKLLKGINAKRAAGQIILAATIATEDSVLQQYGLWLIQEADIELQAVQSGEVRLAAPLVNSDGLPLDPTTDPDDADPYARTPSAYIIDQYSPVAAFEANIHQGQDVMWAPRDGTRSYPYMPYPRGH
jgi:hypothetical protein